MITPEQTARQAEMLANRVAKNHKHLRRRFEAAQVDAYRLYDRDIPEVRCVVDWYAGHLLVAAYARQQTDAAPEWLPTVARAAAERLGVPWSQVHLRERRTGGGDPARYERLASEGARVVVREGDLRFVCDLDRYLDTGLFPDHRVTRARVRAESAGRDVLNLYGYTGAFTVAAAKGGARSTTTVDLSGVYLAWCEENLRENGLDGPSHHRVRAEAEGFLRASSPRWDVAVLDPPSFSTVGADGPLDVARDHRRLVERALGALRAGGVLWFSTNHQRFEPALDGLAAREVREVTAETVPEDYRNRAVHRCWRIAK